MAEKNEKGETIFDEERRAHMWDRVVVIAVAVITAVISTYITTNATIASISTKVEVNTTHLQQVVAREAALEEKVESMAINQSHEDAVREEILRRLTVIEGNQKELMDMLAKMLVQSKSGPVMRGR